MMSRRRKSSALHTDRPAEYYKQKRDKFNIASLNDGNYADNSRGLQKLMRAKWNKYCAQVEIDPEQALKAFTDQDVSCFLDWLVEESRGGIGAARSVQTYWNTLCTVRKIDTGHLTIDADKKYRMTNARQKIIDEHKLRTEPKVKPIMRAEDEFECLRTLWSSEELKFDIEIHRISLALLMQLAGITGNRPKALLQLRFKDIVVALLPDPHGSEWPRLIIEWKFNTTKTYKGTKDANEFPIPDIPNEPCLLLCPHVTFLSLAFLLDAFDVPGLSPSRIYSSKVLHGKGQQIFPWKRGMWDAYVFRKSVRSIYGVDLSNDHLPYEALNMRLKKVGELTGFSLPVGAYCFRRGNGEALDNSGDISDAQRNLCLQHAPNSSVFQRNYLSRHITISTHDAYRKLPQQVEIMRAATGMSRTIDRRRPRFLTLEQEEEIRNYPTVQELLTKKLNLKRKLKSEGGTIKSHAGTAAYGEYSQLKQAYESEVQFQRKRLLQDVRQRFDREQAIADLQAQFNGEHIEDEDDKDQRSPSIHPQRLVVLDALFKIRYPNPEDERARRVTAIEAMLALGKLQDGHHYPVRHRRPKPVKGETTPETRQETGACKPRQCFFCVARQNYHEYHSRGDLKKHILRCHVQRHKADEDISCPLDGHILDGGWQHVLAHAHNVHGTPLCKSSGMDSSLN